MATGNTNKKSDKKGIRFPHEMIEQIDASVEREKAENPAANFSQWVIDACAMKLAEQLRKRKS
ncbi:DUF3950 domain-containing protein [Cronobacter dublinensis]|nr:MULTISPECIES: YlcI/YnfO family protein [Cronobacter]EKY3087697.1 DUF3950 domain-containing protein [Cronobacter dublinensis]ELQ6227536.1 DUF3950 domain-containing protein [Cronobacter dublinensis]MDI7389595.1 YlcI/YnfO family protein [Cronobacter dublinensis]NUW60141.1 DUF3950 domain-containing protein [Cronobacter muytjensii]